MKFKTDSRFILAAFLLLSLFAGSMSAATTIGGMAFDIGVVNDNGGLASSFDYSYSNSSDVVTISGIQPQENTEIAYFLNHASNNDESQVVLTIDISQFTENQSEAGVMFFQGLFASSASTQSWCRLAISGEKKIYFEEQYSCSAPLKKHLYTLEAAQNQVRIKANIASGTISFCVSQPITSIDTSWLSLGSLGILNFSHSFGFFIKPASNLIQQQAQFSTISITRTDTLDNGLNDLVGYNTTGIPGLGAWPITSPLPSNFFNQPMQFIEDIRNNYNSGFSDPYQQALFDNMRSLLNQPIEPITGNEVDCIEISLRNARKYLVDIINSFITGETRMYQPNSSQYQLYFGFNLLEYLNDANNLISSCHKATDIHWYDFLNPIEPFIRTYNIIDCAVDAADVISERDDLMDVVTNRDKLIQSAAQYILYLTLLSTMDEEFYLNYNQCVNGYIETVRKYTEKIAPLYYKNNIPMKVLSSIALWDLAHGSTTSSATLNLWLKDKLMDGGGYAEGTAYLDWLNQELLPYYYIAMYNGWLPENLKLRGVINSGYWLLNLADRSGNISPVDDATNNGLFWLAPYGFINNDNAFKEYVSRSFDASSDPIRFLTYPPDTLPGHWTQKEIVTSEGTGKINITSIVDNADISVAFNTEKNTEIKKNGGSHDQQDDGSISIRRVKSGTSNIDNLIVDPGYAGYSSKGDEEYYNNHNTVQINTHSNGGISPCTFSTLEQLMDTYADEMDVDIEGLADNLMGGIVVLTSAFPLVTNMLTTPGAFIYHDVKDMPMERTASGGPGYSELLKTFTNGFQGKIVFDNISGTNYALRSVVHVGDEIFVIDQISSNQNDYSVNYNLPRGATSWNGMDNVYTGTQDESQIRVSVYCSDELDVSSEDKSFIINDQDVTTDVSSVKFSNDGINLPEAGQYCSFLSVLEPADESVSYESTYIGVTGNIGDAQILVSKNITSDLIRYVFVNTITNGTKGTVTIPALTGWHSEFTTDAEFGVIDFDRTTQSYALNTLNLYSANWGSYNGKPVSFNSTTLIPGAMLTKAFGDTVNSVSGYYTDDKLTLCTNRYSRTIKDYSFGYWYYEGDFDFITKLPNFNGINQVTSGFMVRSSLDTSDLNFMWARGVYTTSCPPPVQFCGGIDYTSLQVLKGFNETYYSDDIIDDDTFRCSRKGDKITFYMRDNSFMNSTHEWTKIDSISFTGRSAYIGYTISYSHIFNTDHQTCNEFDTLKVYDGTDAVFFSPASNLNKSLSQLGYTTDGAPVTGWELGQHDGIIYSSASSEDQNVFTFTTPSIQVSRNQQDGVSFEWKVQFPTWYFNQDFSSNNQLSVDLISDDPDNIYTLNFTPVLENTVNPESDLEFLKGNDSVVLDQINTGKCTPIGPDSWVKFKVDVLPQSSQGGTGLIKVYFDVGDGLGYVEYMNLVDEDQVDFTGMKFTYTTGTGLDRYQVIIDSIRIIPIIYTGFAAPIIETQPQSLSVLPGDSATFSVEAYGSNISYKWLKNGQIIPGAITDSYSIASVELSDAGNTYQCLVSNSSGTAVSSIATLTISDYTAPLSEASFNPMHGINAWYNTDVTVLIHSYDTESGVKCITYSAAGANNVNQTTVSSNLAAIQMTAEGSTSMNFFAEDYVGNIEPPKSISVYIDKTDPVTTSNLNTDAKLILTASDNLSGIDRIEYSFDNVNWNTYSMPVDADPNKLNRIYYRSIDLAGNVELIQSSTFYIIVSNGFDAAGNGICEIPPTGVTVVVKNLDYLYGSMFTVRNRGTNDSIIVSWYGVTSQDKSNCSLQSKNLFGNGAQINNVCTSHDSNASMMFTIKSATNKTYYADLETFNWRNGTGCK